MSIEPRFGDALIVIDVQNDFLPGGALAVPGGDRVIAPLNRLTDLFAGRDLHVIFTRDWHPANHRSFQTNGGAWPPHCVAGTQGAEFANALGAPSGVHVVSKGTAEGDESYSNFEGTELAGLLRRHEISRLYVGGLATEYCVRATVRDALRLGFAVVLLTDAIGAIDVSPGDGQRAIDELRREGAVLARSEDLR